MKDREKLTNNNKSFQRKDSFANYNEFFHYEEKLFNVNS